MAGGAATSLDPYGRMNEGYDNANSRGYGQSQSSLAVDQYGMAGAAGRRSPRDYAHNDSGYPGPQPGYTRSRQASYDDYGQTRDAYGGDRQPRIPDVMGSHDSYNDQAAGYDGGFGSGRYGAPAPQRQYSSDSQRPLKRPPMQQQYSNYSQDSRMASPLQDNSGFDFSSGYSRPSTRGRDEYSNFSRPGAGAPPPQQGGGAYPGYKPYQPGNNGQIQQGWSGL
jgi:hypothetical protein